MQKLLFVFLILTLSLLSPSLHSAAFVAPETEADEFHFVVLGDAQFHQPEKFNRLIDQVRRLRPAFVIQVGDLIEGYNSDLQEIRREWERFADQVAPLDPVAFLPVPGNHDVFGGEKQVDPRLEAMFEEFWGPLYWAFTYKNTLLVSLNSDSVEGANQITGQQLAWLQETLAKHDAEHTFVFMHRPPLLLANAEALHKLFLQHGVSHVFYGHHHHYHFFTQDGIAYTMTNAAANSAHDHHGVGGFHHLLQVSVRGAEVDVAVIEADAIKLQNAVRPQDNYDFFDLTQRLAPRQVALEASGGNTYTMTIPLRNTSRRDIEVLVSCSSADHRWQIEPTVIEPLALTRGGEHTLTLQASFSDQRVPESQPVCDLRVPFQTAHGEWLDFRHRVNGVR